MFQISGQVTFNLAANGNTTSLAIPGRAFVSVALSATPTWGSGTLVLQTTLDGTNWFNVPNASWTSGGPGKLGDFEVAGVAVRLSLSGATSPSLVGQVVEADRMSLDAETVSVNNNDTVFPVLEVEAIPQVLAASVIGTFNSTTVTLQGSYDGVTWIPLQAFTANALYHVTNNNFWLFRFVAAGGTGVGLVCSLRA